MASFSYDKDDNSIMWVWKICMFLDVLDMLEKKENKVASTKNKSPCKGIIILRIVDINVI